MIDDGLTVVRKRRLAHMESAAVLDVVARCRSARAWRRVVQVS